MNISSAKKLCAVILVVVLVFSVFFIITQFSFFQPLQERWATFTCDAMQGDYPLVAQFTSFTEVEPVSFLWDFGDGYRSRLPNPVHVYQSPGTYTVRMTAASRLGIITVVCENLIQVTESPPAGHLYYVAPWGDNANPGTEAEPWRNLQYAVAQLAPGDTLEARGGVYRLGDIWDDCLTPSSGIPGSWVKIRARPGEQVIIRGSPAVENGQLMAVNLTGAQYVALQGLIIDGEGPDEETANIRWGIYGDNCHHLALAGLYINWTADSGIHIHEASHLLFEDINITHTCFSAVDLGINDDWEAGVSEVTFRSCHFDGAGAGAWTNPMERADAVACEVGAGPLYIEYSTAVNCTGDGWDVKLDMAYIYNTLVAGCLNNIKVWHSAIIENNILYNLEDTNWDSVFFDGGDPTAQVIFVHNLIYGSGNYALAAGYDYPGTPSTYHIYNNIIVEGDGPAFFQVGAQVHEDHNLYYNNPDGSQELVIGENTYSREQINAGEAGPHDQSCDPHLANSKLGNFTLQPGSPAINTGYTGEIAGLFFTSPFDFNDQPRNAQPDLGPLEKQDNTKREHTTTHSWNPSTPLNTTITPIIQTDPNPRTKTTPGNPNPPLRPCAAGKIFWIRI